MAASSGQAVLRGGWGFDTMARDDEMEGDDGEITQLTTLLRGGLVMGFLGIG